MGYIDLFLLFYIVPGLVTVLTSIGIDRRGGINLEDFPKKELFFIPLIIAAWPLFAAYILLEEIDIVGILAKERDIKSLKGPFILGAPLLFVVSIIIISTLDLWII